ncbi:unnamed protein product [Caenorhabditis angaria]|uniref:Phospholipid/glycerol acyltransferase domain-containing protein n=1 Tax=Caenorhabditis angaria TaxID=860376 RepID=A0A9P1N6K4_9PELO|nr:unnamed protein product [Caenorhabditis angaria]
MAPKLWREVADRLVGYWLTFPCSLVEWVFGVKFRVTGDLIDRNSPAIFIMNHRTRLDWLFLWNALYKMDPWLLTTEKITLKSPLRNIPGAGWAMSCGSYIFLNRNFENDQPNMTRIIKYFVETKKNYQILLFPEGTDKSDWANERSHNFAEKNGLTKFDYVLHPRTTGFSIFGEIVQTEIDLMKNGKFPEKVHLDVKKYDIEDLNKEIEEPEKWLTKLWNLKETRLRRFYEQKEHVLEPSGKRFVWPETTSGLGYTIAFSFWCLTSIFWIYTIYSSFWVKIYSLFAIIFYTSCLKFTNGAEFLFLNLMSSLNEPPVLGAGQPITTRLKGWAFVAGMLFSAFFGVIYIVTPLLVLIWWKPLVFRQFLDRLVGIWTTMPGALMTYLFGASIKIRGDFIDHNEPGLIIMNHRTRLDWLFFWMALYKMDPWLCTTEKISLKGILKYVPGAGWAMQAACYIFLDRSFDSDKSKLDKILEYYAAVGYKYQLLLFPEGTDKCPKATERSRLYAEKTGLIHYDYVLHPRVTGFVHIVQNMRKHNNIKFIYDVTIGFGDAIVQSEVDIAAHGVCPKEVYYQVRKIDISNIPENDEELGKWLIDLWAKKEHKLRKFYEMPRNLRNFDNTIDGNEYEMDDNSEKALKCLVGFWIFTTIFWIFMFFESAIMFWWAVLAIIFYVTVYYIYGGLEFLTIDVFNKQMGYGLVTQGAPVETTTDSI